MATEITATSSRTSFFPHDSRTRVAGPLPCKPCVGQRLGEYQLCLELGSGGMATVYLARVAGRAGLHRFVAVKCIRADLASDPTFVEMFFDEAQIASQIHHANVCSVLDFDRHDGVHYLVMEYLSGQPLSQVAREMRREPDRWPSEHLSGLVARIVADAAEGLHAAHELRNGDGELLEVVHRDVSLDNLFVTYDGNVEVMDFGVACASDQRHKTRTGFLKGKFAYLAPEVLRGAKPNRCADVWALGVVAWELLTGRRLFAKGNDMETLQAIADDPIPPPSSARRGLPPLLDDLVLGALQRNPASRYKTAREFGRLLNRFLVESQLVIGLAEVAEAMQDLFPEGRACARQLLALAEQLEGGPRPPARDAFDGEPADGSGRVARPSPQPAAGGRPVSGSGRHRPAGAGADDAAAARPGLGVPWAKPPRLTHAAFVGLLLLLLLVGARTLGGGREPGATRDPQVAASGASAPAVAASPVNSPAPARPGQADPARRPSGGEASARAVEGQILEVQSVGTDGSGAILLRLRLTGATSPGAVQTSVPVQVGMSKRR